VASFAIGSVEFFDWSDISIILSMLCKIHVHSSEFDDKNSMLYTLINFHNVILMTDS
jgi:hypothetical protein